MPWIQKVLAYIQTQGPALAAAFDEANVEIPFPRQVVYHRQEDGAVLQTNPSQV